MFTPHHVLHVTSQPTPPSFKYTYSSITNPETCHVYITYKSYIQNVHIQQILLNSSWYFNGLRPQLKNKLKLNDNPIFSEYKVLN